MDPYKAKKDVENKNYDDDVVKYLLHLVSRDTAIGIYEEKINVYASTNATSTIFKYMYSYKCPVCTTRVDKDFIFCPRCGSRFQESKT